MATSLGRWCPTRDVLHLVLGVILPQSSALKGCLGKKMYHERSGDTRFCVPLHLDQ